jgi:1-acyl-sn-glycerol-3-phosphate acyltransferase
MPDRAPRDITERPVTLRGSRVAAILLRLAGWRVVFDGLPAPQGVAIVYPHTSNWDLPIGLLAKWAIGIRVVFWGKDSLFDVPAFGGWLRWVGGIPVDRHAPHGAVGEMTMRMQQAVTRGDFLWLALSPEGTRSHRDGWRSGFYRVAVDASVPLALVVLDFKARRVGVVAVLRLCGDPEIDMATIARHYAGVEGRHPHLASPVRFV